MNRQSARLMDCTWRVLSDNQYSTLTQFACWYRWVMTSFRPIFYEKHLRISPPDNGLRNESFAFNGIVNPWRHRRHQSVSRGRHSHVYTETEACSIVRVPSPSEPDNWPDSNTLDIVWMKQAHCTNANNSVPSAMVPLNVADSTCRQHGKHKASQIVVS
jgi:hypothetical protein